MRHATTIALDALERLLEKLRAVEGISERKRGSFYRGSRAFLHFHEDPAGFFADVRLGPAWSRLEVSTPAQQRELVKVVKKSLR